MTLLGAVLDDRCAFVGADSLKMWVGEGYGTPVQKLRCLASEPVVWGCYGVGSAIAAFEKHVSQRKFHTWDNLAYHLGSSASLLDREHFSAGGFGVLFAGVLDADWRIVAFGSHSLQSEGWCFVGNNRLVARVAWEVAGVAPLSNQERFRLAMSTVIAASDPVLRPPLNLWRVTADGCEQLEGAS